MTLSLLDVLEMPELKGAILLDKDADLSRRISGISIYDGDEYESGNILVFDSGKAEVKWEQIGSVLEENEVNAIFIKPNGNMELIKKETENAKPNLPVILLSTDITIAEVIRQVKNRLNETDLFNMRHYKNLHDKFTSLAIDGEGLEKMIEYLKKEIGNPVVIYDREFNTIISTDSEISHSTMDQYARSEEQNLNILYYNQQMVSLPNMDKQVKRIIFPIRLDKKIRAYLAVFELNKTLVEQDYISLEMAATTAILEMKRRLSMAEVEKKFQNDLIYDVISNKFDLEDVIYERASLMGLNLRKSFSVVVIKIGDSAISDEEDLRIQSLERIQKSFENHLKYYLSKHVMGNIGSSIILLWPVEDKSSPELVKNIKGVFHNILDKLQHDNSSISLTAGIGRIATQLREIKTSYLEALDTVTYGSLLYGENTCTEFNEIGIFKILCKFENSEELTQFIPESLHKLMEYDQKNRSNFVKTLEAYLVYNSNARNAAKGLFIHYKTMLYRLERIREISCVDLNDYEEKLQIQIGLKILYLLERKKEESYVDD